MGWGGVGWGGHLFEAGCSLTFSAFSGRLFEVGTTSRLGAFSKKYGNYLFYFTAECHQLWNLKVKKCSTTSNKEMTNQIRSAKFSILARKMRHNAWQMDNLHLYLHCN